MGDSAHFDGNFSGDFAMSFQSISDIIGFLKNTPIELPFLFVLLTGSILVLVRDWRASIAALVIQYLAMGALLAQSLRVEIVIAKIMTGAFVGLILYLSARQAGWQNRPTFSNDGLRALGGIRFVGGEVFPPGRVFRLLLTLLLLVVAVSLAQSYPINLLSQLQTISIYWLLLVGVSLLILSENPLKVGQGLLTFFMGFELWYTISENSLLMVGLLGAVNLMLAVSVGYLGIIRGVQVEEDF